MRFILCFALVPIWVGAAAADPLLLAETPLATGRCKIIATAKPDDAGEPLKRRAQYASGWRCKGYQGRFVFLAYDDQREGLAFGSARSASTEYMWPSGFGAWGPFIEWRGPKGTDTRDPLAAIVRYSWNIPAGSGGEPPDIGADLAVIRVGRGREDTCVVAWVDATANADAAELARKRADEALSQPVCDPKGQPERLGKINPKRQN